jgi:LPS O-antigen subunit length determinant protein (WzzB/FepE family)
MSPPISRFDTVDAAIGHIYGEASTNALKQFLNKLPPEQRDMVSVQIDMQRMQELTQLVSQMIKDEERKKIIQNMLG